MIHILLADDDILSLNRLLNLIDWNAKGYEIIGQALNGNDCIQLLKKTCPDILILDIDMPDKNGVEITKEIQELHLNTKILILSNYDTFTFVRDTLHNGAYDYLLKHELTGESLLGKLKELEKLIEEEKISHSHMSFFTTVAKQKFFYRLLSSRDIGEQPSDGMMLAQPDFSSRYYCLCIMKIPNFILLTHFTGIDAQKMIDSISNLATSIFTSTGNGIITHIIHGHFALLFHFNQQNSAAGIHDAVSRSMRLLESNIRKLWDMNILYQIGDIFTDISYIGKIYDQLGNAFRLYPSPESAPSEQRMNIQEERDLMNALTAFRPREVETLLQNAFSRMLSVSSVLSPLFLEQLIQIGIRFSQNQGMPDIKSIRHSLNVGNLTQISPKDIENIFLEYYKDIMDRAPGQGSRHYSVHIQNALLFIHNHYDEEINLKSLAEYLHLSPTHLSRLFRKETGTSFIDYLVTYRVERARDLIRQSNLDLHLIGDKVGFHSYNYFLRAYKEKTGHTPTQDMKSDCITDRRDL